MKNTIQAVIFDNDGTLLDTREFIFVSYEYTLNKFNFEVPTRVEMAKHMGKTLDNAYRSFAPLGDNRLLCEVHHTYQMSRYDLLNGYEGLHDVLSSIKSAGLKIGICTSRSSHVKDLLKQVGVLHLCDAIVSKDDVVNHKPHAEGVLKVLQLLDVVPAEAVMVGDTDADIESGKNAEVALTIGVTHGFGTRESLASAGANYIVDRLADILPIVLPQ
jgi:HAD superfamily hydrolase (TIGR01549 family)